MDLQNKIDASQKEILLLEKKLKNLFEEEKEISSLIESLDDQIYRIRKDKDGDYIIMYNEGKIAEKYGLRTKQIQGKKMRQLVGDELHFSLKPYYDRAFHGEIVNYRGFKLNDRYYSTVLSPFKKNKDGIITEIIGNTQDITEQYYTEEKFNEKTEVLNNIIELNPYGIQICDAEGHHLKCNKAFLDLFIFPPPPQWTLFNDQLIKKSEFNDKMHLITKGKMITTPPMWYNAHLIDPNVPDNLICISTVIFPVFIVGNKLENIVLMFEDITHKIHIEEDLKKRIEELEAFHDMTVNRELKMKQIEEKIEELTRTNH